MKKHPNEPDLSHIKEIRIELIKNMDEEDRERKIYALDVQIKRLESLKE
jgi:hypothetical protein